MSWCRARSGTCDQILLPVGTLLSYFCRAPSLTRGRVYSFQCNHSCSESRTTRNHTLLSRLRLPQLGDQIPLFISSRNRVVQLYPLVLCFLYVAIYDSQGYGGGILTRFHTNHYIDFGKPLTCVCVCVCQNGGDILLLSIDSPIPLQMLVQT
jgi:hypothetical protein